MRLTIIGTAQSGKTTLFHALVGSHMSRAKGYFSHIGTFVSKDPRVFRLGKLVNSRKITPITYEVGDFDGFGTLWKEERSGEIVQELNTSHVFLQVIPAFRGVDIIKEFDELNLRLILSDLRFVERRLDKLEKEVKAKKSSPRELELLRKIEDTLLEEKPVSTLSLSREEIKLISGYPFITIKPRIAIININEKDINSFNCPNKIKNFPSICTPLNVEKELSELEDEKEKEALIKEYGLSDSAVHRLEEIILKELGYIIFYTVGEKETKAWLLKKGATVYEAAGKIHSDIQRGFIKAEVIHYEDFVRAGNHKEAKNQNLMHLEGKDYVVQDGDVINIRFSI